MTNRVDAYRDAIERSIGTADAVDEVPAEQLFQVLSAPRRIAELTCILEADRQLSIEALVNALVAGGAVDHDARELSVLIYHCDLPLLDEIGIVSVDFDDGHVTPTPTASAIANDLPPRSRGPT